MQNTTGKGFYHKGVRLGAVLITVASLIIGGIFISSALAVHTAEVTAAPIIVAGSTTNTYSFGITNNAATNFIYWVDFTAPTGFTITNNPICPTGWGTSHTTGTAACSGNANPVANKNIQPGATTTISFSAISSAPEKDTTTSWTVITTDNAFDTATANPAVTVDVTAPVTTDNAPGGWLNEIPATITLTATDETAQVAATYYTTDGNDPTTTSAQYIGPFQIEIEGTSTLKYFSVDNVGNAETIQTNTVSIDTVSPTITSPVDITLPGGQGAVKVGDIITISAEVNDFTSDVASVTVDLLPLGGLSNSPLEFDEVEGLYINEFTVADGITNELKTLTVTATDNAGNTSTDDSATVFFDNTAPTSSDLTIAPLEEGVTAVRNSANITISGTVTDDTTSTLISATLHQYDDTQTEITTSSISSITLTGNTFSGTINVGELAPNAATIVITVQVVDEALNASALASSPLEVDLNSADIISTTLYPPQEPYAQTKVKDMDTVGVRVVTNDSTANTVTIDASGFGADSNISLNPDGSGTDFVGTFTVNSLNATGSILATVRRTNNGATATGESIQTLTIDNTDPIFSSIVATPNPAKAGTVTITFTASETLLQNPTVNVNSATSTFSSINGLDYTYTYEVVDTNQVLPATITITGFDEAANEGTDSSAFTIDTLEPTVTAVSSDGARFNPGTKTITVTFSEEIADPTPLPQIAIAYSGISGTCSNITATDITRTSTTTYVYDLVVSDDCDAAIGTITIDTAEDLAGNAIVADSSHTFIVDTVAPTILSAVTADTDGDGQIDTIVVNFDEDLNETSIAMGDFTVTGYTVTSTVESATGTVTLAITEISTPDTGVTPQVDIVSAIADLAGNETTSGNVTPTDGAAPIAVSAETISVNTIEVTFSEDLNGASVSTADFVITDHTISGTSELSSGIVTLTLSSTLGTGETPTISVGGDGTSSGIQDLADIANWTTAHSVPTTDGIAPVVTNVTLSPDSPVKAEDVTFTIIFSEPMDELTAPTVTYDPQGDPNGAAPQTITQTSFTGTTWVGTALIPSNDAANYDGTATISISGAKDNAFVGNVMAEDTSETFEIDTVAPDAPLITTEAQTLNASSIAIEGTAETNTIITITGGLATATGTATGENFSISVNLTQDTTSTLSVTATDAAGNVSTPDTLVIVEDSTPPNAPSITTLSQVVNTTTTLIEGTAETNSIIIITGGLSTTTGTADEITGAFSITVTLNQNVLNTLFVTATDAADNISATSTVNITHDNIAPVAIFATSTLPAGLTNATSATISVTNGDVVFYKYDLDNGGYSAETPVATDITLILTEATHTLSIIGRDAAGNWQETPTTYSWTVDITPPTLSPVTIASNNSDTSLAKVDDTITLTFTSNEEVTTPTVYIAGNPTNVSGDGTNWTATYALNGSEVEDIVVFTIDFTDIAGNNGITVTATDDGSSVTFDQTEPAINITSPLTTSRVNGNTVVSFDDDEITDPECSIDNNTWEVCESGVTTLSQIPDFDVLPEGAFTLYLRDIDPTGNVGSDSETDVIKDITAPTISSNTPSTNAVNVEPANNITITFSEEVNVGEGNITLNPEASFTIDGSGTNTITLIPDPELANNTVYTVTISTNVSDSAGNQLENQYDWQFTTATQYDIALYTAGGGWNLVSLPIIPNDENISTVLGDAEGSIEAVWTYDPSHPNAVDGWLAYIPGDPDGTNNLDTMTAGYGYWISVNGNVNISGAGNLLTAGPNLPPSRDLGAGWNLVGYYQIPGESSSNPGSAFSSLGSTYTGLWGFNNQTGNFMSTVNEILPGDAFWISLPSAKTYTPSNVNNAT